MALKASIDIGSNSTLLLVLDTETKAVITEESSITSLGKDLDQSGVFAKQSMIDTTDALKRYVKICEKHGIQVNAITATATEAARVAKNSSEFFDKIKKELGLNVILITGEGEAYYTAFGISQMATSKDEFVIMDIGGASTELIHVKLGPFKIIETISLPIGSVRSTDWISTNQFEEKFKNILNDYSFSPFTKKDLICVAGTMTSLALVFNDCTQYDSDTINLFKINSELLNIELDNFSKKSDDDISKAYPFLGKRLKSIKGGAICAQKIISQLELNSISFSTYGLRYGTALSGVIDESFCV